jgi:membrane protein required for colicin V production
MHAVDIIIVVVVSFCLIRGLFRGLIREVASIVGVLAGFYGACAYHGQLVPVVERFIANEGYRRILCFFLLFCVIFAAVSLIGVVIRHLLNIAFLGWIDRLCGLVFGAMKGCLIVAVMIMGLTAVVPGGNEIMAGSRLGVHVVTVSTLMSTLVSGRMKTELQHRLEGMQKLWENQQKTRQKPV